MSDQPVEHNIENYIDGSLHENTEEYPIGLPPPEEMREDFRKLVAVSTPQNILFGEYFANKGDYRIRDKVMSEVGRVLEKYNMTPQSILGDINKAISMHYTQDPMLQQQVWDQAMKEIEEGI